MNHKILFTATALILMSGSAFAQTSTCPDGMTPDQYSREIV